MIGTKFVAGAAPLLSLIQGGMLLMGTEAWWWWSHRGDDGPLLGLAVWVTVSTALLAWSLAAAASTKGQPYR